MNTPTTEAVEKTESDTPRTDAEMECKRQNRLHESTEINPGVSANFSRTLEKELAAAHLEIERLRRALEACQKALHMWDGGSVSPGHLQQIEDAKSAIKEVCAELTRTK